MRKPNILICDDQEGVRKSLKLILENDYTLSFVSNGQEAIDYIKTYPTELIILDIKMPKMNGLEVLRQIREISPHTKSIILTGYIVGINIVKEAMSYGACEYLPKPVENETLLSAVQRALK
jgi:YesN/AraC family two-component response regulator